MSVMRIVVVRGGALGDALLTIHPLAALRTCYGAATITCIGPRVLRSVGVVPWLVDRLIPIEDEGGWQLFRATDLPTWLECDIGVVWLQQWQHVADVLRQAGPSQVVAGPSLPPEGSSLHVVEHLFKILEPLDVTVSCARLPLPLAELSMQKAGQCWRNLGLRPGKVVALHPGSGGLWKRLPRDYVEWLIEHCVYRGWQVLVLLGPAEEEERAWWARWCIEKQSDIRLAPAMPIDVLAVLIARCSLYIGCDTGPSHLAALTGVRCLVFFGPTDARRWRPWGPRVSILDSAGSWPPPQERTLQALERLA